MINYQNLPRKLIILGIIMDVVFIIFFISAATLDFNAEHPYIALFEGALASACMLDLYCLANTKGVVRVDDNL